MPVRAATPRRTKTPVVLAAVVLAFAALVVPWIGHWAHARAPFQPSEMNLSLTLAVVPVSEVQNAIEGYGISGDQLRAVQPKSATQEAVVGQLSFSIPKRMPDESQMALFVIDERTHALTQQAWGFTEGANKPGSGFDAKFAGFATRYPWLKATAFSYKDGSYAQPGTAITIGPGVQGPLTFYAVLDPIAIQVSDVTKDVLVALGFVGPEGQIYWAQRLAATDQGQ